MDHPATTPTSEADAAVTGTPVAGPTDDTAAAGVDDLVEDVSIDGMCGVY